MNLIAEVLHFPKSQEQQQMQEANDIVCSARFKYGYVMSSRLYRNEVYPFLSDAARNVYVELENHINGHNKTSDFVSYSQLQAGELAGSRKLSRGSVSDGIDELLKKGVISILGSGKRGVKRYQINEVSLAQQSDSRTSADTEPVRLPTGSSSVTEPVDRVNSSASAPVTSSASALTIDNIEEDEEEEYAREENKKFTAQNRSMQFVEYYTKDRLPISLKDLFKKYPAQIDFQDQAKISFPNHSHEQIFTELQKLGQWSLSASNLIPQKWMSVWLDWMRKVPTLAEVATAAERQKQSIQKPQKPKYHQYGQEPATPSIRDVGGSHE